MFLSGGFSVVAGMVEVLIFVRLFLPFDSVLALIPATGHFTQVQSQFSGAQAIG